MAPEINSPGVLPAVPAIIDRVLSTMPISRMIPINATSDSSNVQNQQRQQRPHPADGRLERIVIGWM